VIVYITIVLVVAVPIGLFYTGGGCHATVGEHPTAATPVGIGCWPSGKKRKLIVVGMIAGRRRFSSRRTALDFSKTQDGRHGFIALPAHLRTVVADRRDAAALLFGFTVPCAKLPVADRSSVPSQFPRHAAVRGDDSPVAGSSDCPAPAADLKPYVRLTPASRSLAARQR